MEAEAPSTSEKIPSPGPTAGSTSAAGDANCAGPTEGVDVSVTKCANYLKTLVTLAMAAKGPDEPKAGLRQLVRVSGTILFYKIKFENLKKGINEKRNKLKRMNKRKLKSYNHIKFKLKN